VSFHPARKHGNVVVIAVASLEAVERNDKILVDRLQVTIKNVFLLEVPDQRILSVFCAGFIKRFGKTVRIAEEEKVVKIGNKPFVNKRKRVQCSQYGGPFFEEPQTVLSVNEEWRIVPGVDIDHGLEVEIV